MLTLAMVRSFLLTGRLPRHRGGMTSPLLWSPARPGPSPLRGERSGRATRPAPRNRYRELGTEHIFTARSGARGKALTARAETTAVAWTEYFLKILDAELDGPGRVRRHQGQLLVGQAAPVVRVLPGADDVDT